MSDAEVFALTEAHRLAQVRLAAQVARDVDALFQIVNVADLDRSFVPVSKALTTTIRARRAISAGLAAGYVRQLRLVEEAPGPAVVVSGADVDQEAVVTSLRVTGPVTAKRAIASGSDPLSAVLAAKEAVKRAAYRHVIDGSRLTALRSIAADDQARGYLRVSDGNPCAFCAMLVGRGPVYRNEITAGFRAHDGCGCQARPFWSATPAMTRQAQELGAFYDEHAAGGDYKTAIPRFRKAYDDAYGAKTRRAPSAATTAA